MRNRSHLKRLLPSVGGTVAVFALLASCDGPFERAPSIALRIDSTTVNGATLAIAYTVTNHATELVYLSSCGTLLTAEVTVEYPDGRTDSWAGICQANLPSGLETLAAGASRSGESPVYYVPGSRYTVGFAYRDSGTSEFRRVRPVQFRLD